VIYTLLVLVLIAGAFYGGLRATDYIKKGSSSPASNVALDPLQAGREAFEKGDYRGAQAEFESLSKRDPSNARALYWLGRAQLEMRDYEGAARTLEEATVRQPSMYDAYIQQAAAYEAMGDKNRAAASLARYAEERRKQPAPSPQ
jgi:TolA-binding protein